MSTHLVCFYGEISKINLQLSPSTLLICSTAIENLKSIFISDTAVSFSIGDLLLLD